MATADNSTPHAKSLPLPTGPRAELAEEAAGEIELLACTLLEHSAELSPEHRFMAVLLARVRDLAQVVQTAMTHDRAEDFEAALADFEAGH